MILSLNNTKFGIIDYFEGYELDIVKRNKFAQIPKRFLIEKYPESDIDLLDDERLQFSTHFFDEDFIKTTIQRTKDSTTPFKDSNNNFEDTPLHHFSIKSIYDNLQRLCYEVMEPAYEVTGRIPFIESGLLFRDNIKGVDMDSFFADQIQGNAVVFNFKNDKDNALINKCANYIKEFSLFDRIYIDNTFKKYERTTLMVSVNDKKRGVVGLVRRK
jgi:hypothetical protein